MPPLAERLDDIPELVAAFAATMPRDLTFTPAALQLLGCQRWPGNVRELRNVGERLAVLATGDSIDAGDIERYAQPGQVVRPDLALIARAIRALPADAGPKLARVEDEVVRQALEAAHGNKTVAAAQLGIDRKKLDRRLERA